MFALGFAAALVSPAAAWRGAMGGEGMDAREAIEVPEALRREAILLDGLGSDPVWGRAKDAPAFGLDGGAPENPSRKTGCRFVRAGKWFLVRFEAGETEGIVARETIAGAILWMEDVVGVRLARGDSEFRVRLNPLGNLWVSRDGKEYPAPIGEGRIKGAAAIGESGWSGEIAVDLGIFGATSGEPAELEVAFMRQRQQRGLAPYEEPYSPPPGTPWLRLSFGPSGNGDGSPDVRVAPRRQFAPRGELRAGRCAELPRDTVGWAAMPAHFLTDEDPVIVPAAGFQPTEVRAAIAKEAMALCVVCHDSNPDLIAVSDTGGIYGKDDVEVMVGPEDFCYLQILVNPKGRVETALGKTGGRGVKGIPVPDGVRAEPFEGPPGWSFVLHIPFAEVLKAVGAPASREMMPEDRPWRVQIVRNRPAREKLDHPAQCSVLARTLSATAHCPARFAVLRPTDPAGAPVPAAPPKRPELPPPALDAAAKAEIRPAAKLAAWLDARKKSMHEAWAGRFERIADAEEWRHFAGGARARLMRSMFPPDGKMPERAPMNVKVVYDHAEDGFRCQGLIFEAQRGLPASATMFLPEGGGARKRPAMIMIPAHHTGRNSTDLIVFGANMARAGGIALSIDSLASDERSVSALWEHKSYQRNMLGAQLMLAGEELAGWTAFEISRCVDYLLERGDVDPARVGIIGGVAGGGDISALAAALDERITVSIPFNFSTNHPFGGYWDPCRTYVGAHAAGITPWLVNALAAPRALLQAQEFAWEEGCRRSFELYRKVYGWLGAEKNLDFLHGGPNTHATHFNVMHRIPAYRILNRWWNTRLPEKEAEEYRPSLRNPSLKCYAAPAGRETLGAMRASGRLREAHELAAERAAARLAERRARRGNDAGALRSDLAALLKVSEPAKLAVKAASKHAWRGADVEALWLEYEDCEDAGGPGLAMWLLLPKGRTGRCPLALGAARAGKADFLAARAGDVEKLLGAGVAVALLDARGCGETSPGGSRFPEGPAGTLASVFWMQNDSLPARQIKDVRSALAYLAGREDVDPARLALWGEDLSEPNGRADRPLLFDETGFRQSSPTPLSRVEPMGCLAALAAAMFPVDAPDGKQYRVRAVLVRDCLVSFASALKNRHHYLPVDAVVPGISATADIPDIVRALAAEGVAVAIEGLRDGRNLQVAPESAAAEFAGAELRDHRTHRAAADLAERLKK